MSHVKHLVFLLLLTVVSFSCERSRLEQEKYRFHVQAENQIERMEQRLNDLENKKDELDESARAKFNASKTALKSELSSAKSSLQQMQKESAASWQDFKRKMQETLNNIEQRFNQELPKT